MLDFFSILTKGGLVLWWYQDQLVQHLAEDFAKRINELIHSAILEGSADFSKDNMTLKYKLDNEFDLVFVVGYQTVIKISYADQFLDAIQRRFRDKYSNMLAKEFSFNLFHHDDRCQELSGFTAVFDEEYDKFRGNATGGNKVMRTFMQSNKHKNKTVESLRKDFLANKKVANNNKAFPQKIQNNIINKHADNSTGNTTASTGSSSEHNDGSDQMDNGQDDDQEEADSSGKINHTMLEYMTQEEKIAFYKEKAKLRKKGPNNKGNNNNLKTPKKKKPKEKQEWNDVRSGRALKKSKLNDALDYSTDKPNLINSDNKHADDVGINVKTGAYGKLRAVEASAAPTINGAGASSSSKLSAPKPKTSFFSMFKTMTSKKLNLDDIKPALEKMKEHLIGKNVATDIADKITNSVGKRLEGKFYNTFQGINNEIKTAVEATLTEILTPKRRVDILRDILYAKEQKKPYVITFCGVNGVGKSTNLAKICFWLVENNHNVMIAAGDTFRAGAVEQLKTHVKRINSFYQDEEKVFLYDQGYGKDAADIAFNAIRQARDKEVDVVLVDTAGRMQDNTPLMIALAKLITVNKPDLVLFVGEALVGNEAVDQLVKFNQALADNSRHVKNAQTIDGIVLTKFDTIDDKVGAAISMTYTTGQPIVFVGTGQSYPDLRRLDVKNVVQTLLKE